MYPVLICKSCFYFIRSWHGCLACIVMRNTLSADGYKTAREAYDRTMERQEFIQDQGYQVIEKWECKLKMELEENPKMKEFFEPTKLLEPLNPRDG